jgi:hypothetical protein
MWLFPTRLRTQSNWIPALSMGAATAGLLTFDPIEGRYFHQTSRFQGFNQVFTSNATALGTIFAPVSLYVVGLAQQNSKLQRTALLSGEAVTDVEILTTVLKDINRRVRPITFSRQYNYGIRGLKAKALACAVMEVFHPVTP